MAIREKTVVITGAGSPIGHAIALAFAKEEYNVVVADLDYGKAGTTTTEITGIGGEALAVKCDVIKKEEVDDLMTKAVTRYGKINAFVNADEISTPKEFMEITITDWETIMNVNLRGSLLSSQAAAKEMKSGGAIIFISSIASVITWRGMAHYSATKGGLEALMRGAAIELALKNITVNAVSSGVLDIPETNIDIKNEASGKMTMTNPDKIFGNPEDVANAVVFLASGKATYITGQTIVVDGGYTLR